MVLFDLFISPTSICIFRLFEEKNLPISWKSVEKEINLNSYICLLLTLLIIFLSKLNYEFVEASFKAQLNKLKVIFILTAILLIPFFSFTTLNLMVMKIIGIAMF